MPSFKLRFGVLCCFVSMLAAATIFCLSPVQGDEGVSSVHAGSASSRNQQPTYEELKAAGAKRSRYVSGDLKQLASQTPQPKLEQFRRDVLPTLKRACLDCHGPDEQEGNLRVDTLDPNLQSGNDISWWLEVLAVLNNGEMPPSDAAPLAPADCVRLVEWLSSEIQVASTVRRIERGGSSFRRMTRYEYNHALQDLLELPWDFAKDLPPEATSVDGFQNSSELLHITGMQLDTYRAIARQALRRAMPIGGRPKAVHWSVSMKQASAIEWPKQKELLDKAREKFVDDPVMLEKELDRLEKSFKQPHGSAYFRNQMTGKTA